MRRLLLRAAAGVAAASVAALVGGVGLTSVARADTGAIPLPDPAASASPIDPTALLGPDRPNEVLNRSPGPIDDNETVTIGLTASGDVATVAVDQHLIITGVGDFSLKIPGPAIDVSAPAGSSNQPGLRRGSLIWEGFSGGHKDLEATVALQPELERPKLPIAVHVDGGRIRIENTTAQPEPVADGDPAPGAAEAVLDRVRAAVSAGSAPLPGTAGIPTAVAAAAPNATISTQMVSVTIPFRITGQVDGGPSFDAVVPGPAAPDGVLVVEGKGPVRFTATPSLPDPATVAPASGREALRRAAIAIWQSIRLSEVSAYLGNPKPGHSSTAFRFEPAATNIGRLSNGARPDHPRPLAIALTVAAGIAILAGAAVVWSRN